MSNAKTDMDVPYLSKGMIGLRAGLLLQAYSEEKQKPVTPPIPVDSIMENFLKLQLSFMDMREVFGVDDVAGALWMDTGEVGVDHTLDPEAHPRMEGRYNFTVAHEIGHWWLHRRYKLRKPDPMLPFAQGEQADQTAPTYVCRSSIQNRAEIQANMFASSLLMPKAMVVAIWRDCYGDRPMNIEALRRYGHAALGDAPWIQSGRFPRNEDEYNACLTKAVIRPVAAKFRVSLQAMRICLGELDLLPKAFPLAID